jgi:hypothetical protein
MQHLNLFHIKKKTGELYWARLAVLYVMLSASPPVVDAFVGLKYQRRPRVQKEQGERSQS